MTQYVLGFAFNSAKDYVVLINKKKPEWQKGSFNGVGGKIEPNESPEFAMVREFVEETGVSTTMDEWQQVAYMAGDGWCCYVYTIHGDDLMYAETKTDEMIHVLPVQDVLKGDYPMISNIPFLIELCRDKSRPNLVSIHY